MRTLLGCTLTLAVCFGVSADDKKEEKIDAKMLVGKWEPKEKKEGEPKAIEFTKDGKAIFIYSVKDKEVTNGAGYTLDGDKLTLTVKIADKELKIEATVLKLTDTELTTKNDKGEERTLARVKDKK